MGYEETINGVLSNPSVSFALKAALRAFDERDICDALRDAELLFDLLTIKIEGLV